MLLVCASCGAQPDLAGTDLIYPEALVKKLDQQPRPAIFYVGPPVLYRAAHIPGSQPAGPASKPEALATLKTAVSGLNHDTEIVIYCGCCPWHDCPNVRPAMRLLHDMGFKRAKALYLPTNMRTDWTATGYPVHRPQGPDGRFAQ
jgi:3-mercaptopyruvate sulfurtransferase SseA